MSFGAPDASQTTPTPTMPAGGGGGNASPGGQDAQTLMQVQQLLAQVAQSQQEPHIQRAISSMLQLLDPLIQAVGANDTQDMSSGLNTPNGPEGAAPPDDGSGGGASPSTFGGASKAAAANFADKGHFSKSGSKGEELQTDKAKNRAKAKK